MHTAKGKFITPKPKQRKTVVSWGWYDSYRVLIRALEEDKIVPILHMGSERLGNQNSGHIT
jgi:hypothetical protein